MIASLIPAFDKNAAYIWAIYGVTFAGVIGMLIWTVLSAQIAKQKLDRLKALEESEKRLSS